MKMNKLEMIAAAVYVEAGGKAVNTSNERVAARLRVLYARDHVIDGLSELAGKALGGTNKPLILLGLGSNSKLTDEGKEFVETNNLVDRLRAFVPTAFDEPLSPVAEELLKLHRSKPDDEMYADYDLGDEHKPAELDSAYAELEQAGYVTKTMTTVDTKGGTRKLFILAK
jgi:hypothetical protein